MSATPSLLFTLLGAPQVTRGGEPVVLRSRKQLALLVYLVVEQQRPSSRDTLLTLLWPDAGEDAARNNLRVALADLRRLLGGTDVPFFQATRHTVQFDPASPHLLDVTTFRTLLGACRSHAHGLIEACAACVARMDQAVALYGGDFLHGFALPDSATFEEWAIVQREQLHLTVLDTLETLAAAAERQGDYAALCRYARRQITVEPWRESAHVAVMRGLWMSGQRGAALEHYATCVHILREELGIEPDASTTALYEAIKQGNGPTATARPSVSHPVDTTSAATPPAAILTNLPTPLTPCLGREAELRELVALAQSPDVRLMTLLGVGGIGKTHLSLEVGRALLPEVAHGVYFVPLAPLATPAAIAPAILAALGIAVTSGDPLHALMQLLRGKRLLLILDNFEHLLEGTSIVTDILHGAPQVQIVVTSRERLNLRGEYPYLLQGLAYVQQATLAEATDAAAVRVFAQNANRVHRGFTVNRSNLDAVLRICHLVEGLPLGLELAAAWADSLSPTEIATEIQRSADFLASDWRDLPGRQRSMRAVFAWSWQLLNDAERRVLRGLSVFRGGCTRAAAQTVIDASLRDLTSLTHKSVLRWVEAPDGSGRYEIHELLRQYAAEHLAGVPDERALVAARHADYYLGFVVERERRLTRNNPRAAVAEIRGDLDNVRQAWAWAVAQGNVAALERTAYSLGQCYMLLGLLAEGTQALAAAAVRIDDTLALVPSDPPDRRHRERVLSMLLAFQGMGLNLQSAYVEALPVAQRAVALGQATGAVAGEALGAIVWGEVLVRRGQQQDARPLFERAVRLVAHAEGGLLCMLEWRAEIWLGIMAQLTDAFVAARGHIAHALQLCRAQQALMDEVTCLNWLAAIALSVGDHAAARRDGEHALQLARTLGYPWGEGVAHLRLGQALLALGDNAQAAGVLDGALAIFRQIGDRTYEASTLAYLGRLAGRIGDDARARAQLEQALALSRAVHAYEPALDALVFLAELSSQLGQHELALTYTDQAGPIAQELGSRLRQAQVLIVRSHALRSVGRAAEARTADQHARTLSTEIGVRVPLADPPGSTQVEVTQE